jgi:mannose-1-phosphate guanylyltransferase
MKALLLAGGLGTRLRPLTDFLPKCLAPIGGRPLLEYWLASLFRAGFDELLVNTHHLPELVERYVRQTPWADRTTLVHEKTLAGTAGTVWLNRKFFGKDAFLVAHADNFSVFDPIEMILRHRERPPETVMTMMTFETATPRSCGIVSLDDRGVVIGFHEKVEEPPGTLANAAVYIIERDVVDLIGDLDSPHPDFSTQVLPRLMGRIYTHHNRRFHLDIGTIDTWLEAQAMASLGQTEPAAEAAWRRILDSDNSRIRRGLADFEQMVGAKN